MIVSKPGEEEISTVSNSMTYNYHRKYYMIHCTCISFGTIAHFFRSWRRRAGTSTIKRKEAGFDSSARST